MEPLVFYDLPCNVEGKAWSPNTWKTRYCLNIKGIPYNTVWVEFPDIAPLCQKIGAPSIGTLPDGNPYYAVPVLYDPNTRTTVSESALIARYLEKTYPEPALIPPETRALNAAFRAVFDEVIMTPDLFAIMIPGVFKMINAASQPYFRVTREARLGKPLEELAPAGSDTRAKHWAGIKGAYHQIAEWLLEGAEGSGGAFFGGSRPCYADITVAGFLHWIRAVFGEESEEWRDVVQWDGGIWKKFMAGFAQYEKVDKGIVAKL
ncbi:hypothetical protein C8Q80DRAFT_1216681 [Daedaleopsis nitida]|nr:hypothetical protein C8Q80DRAFT_1216681 [Daedaleopsis nitida]